MRSDEVFGNDKAEMANIDLTPLERQILQRSSDVSITHRRGHWYHGSNLVPVR
jgi:hypothetical protein